MPKEILNKVEETWERADDGRWVDEWGDKNDILALRDLVIGSDFSAKVKKRIKRALDPWIEILKSTITETVVKAMVVKCTPVNTNIQPFIRLGIRLHDDTKFYRWNAPIETYDPVAVDANPTVLLNPLQNSTWVAE